MDADTCDSGGPCRRCVFRKQECFKNQSDPFKTGGGGGICGHCLFKIIFDINIFCIKCIDIDAASWIIVVASGDKQWNIP